MASPAIRLNLDREQPLPRIVPQGPAAFVADPLERSVNLPGTGALDILGALARGAGNAITVPLQTARGLTGSQLATIRDWFTHGPPARQQARLFELQDKDELTPAEQKEKAWLEAHAPTLAGTADTLRTAPYIGPLANATDQAMQGNYPAAAGSLIGGYAMPAAMEAAGSLSAQASAEAMLRAFARGGR